MMPGQSIAVIGGGISGLGAAWALSRRHRVTLFEQADRAGGHSNTVDVDYDGQRIAVDTGFIVYNERNYPHLVKLFTTLGVATDASEMSFSVSVGDGALEWGGSNLGALFAQKRNFLRPGFHRMWWDILRFNREAPAALADGRLGATSLGEYLRAGHYSASFMLDYLLPMGAAIWSAPLRQMQDFPAATFIQFFVNHGLLTINDRPQWRTVAGGSREYVNRLLAHLRGTIRLNCGVTSIIRSPDGIIVSDSAGATARFDHVVLAAHADHSLTMLHDPDADERHLLGAFRYQTNRAVLHRDPALMPHRRAIWSSWNYLSEARRDDERRVALTYWMNRLQNIDQVRPIFVTLNPICEPRADLTFASFDYEHPLFDLAAIAAQRRLQIGAAGSIQGRRNTWFCGSYCGYGFHEDGLSAGLRVAAALGAAPDWTAESPPAVAA